MEQDERRGRQNTATHSPIDGRYQAGHLVYHRQSWAPTLKRDCETHNIRQPHEYSRQEPLSNLTHPLCIVTTRSRSSVLDLALGDSEDVLSLAVPQTDVDVSRASRLVGVRLRHKRGKNTVLHAYRPGRELGGEHEQTASVRRIAKWDSL
jgi:hypothetical protein